MKRLVLFLTILSFFPAITTSGQNNQQKKDPAGTWKFSAPYAPEGYQSGTIKIALADQKYTASMAFTGIEYNFTGSSVKFEKDVLSFSISVESESVAVTLKLDEPLKMTGTAVYSGGTVPLALTKEVKPNGQ